MKLLIIIAAILSCVAAIKVRIQYTPQRLTFTVPENGQGQIQSVTFHIVIRNQSLTEMGTLTRDGWQFFTDEFTLYDGDLVQAFADIYDFDGNVTTTNTSLLLYIGATETRRVTFPPQRLRRAVIFRDDFNSLDLTKWTHEISMFGGGNREFQVYTNDPQNTFVKDGQLYIIPTFTVDDPRFSAPDYLTTGKMDMETLFGSCTQASYNGCSRDGKQALLPPVMSGKLMSVPTLRYGVVEVRARIPTGDWLWPAIWMLPKDNDYGHWPRSGEIVIMESRGNAGRLGVGTVSSTLHWGTSYYENRFQTTSGVKRGDDWAKDFHTWRMEWTDNHIVTYIDDQEIINIDPGSSFWDKGDFTGSNIWASGDKMAPFDKDFYMIFNVAVGGRNSFFPDKGNYSSTKPWKNSQPTARADFWNARKEWEDTWQGDKAAMIIDYIEMRHW